MTDSLRLMCADILQQVGVKRMTRPTIAQGTRMQRGAATLRYAERLEHGDPVTAAEHSAALDEYEERLAGLEQEITQANREAKSRARERRKAFEAFEKAFNEIGANAALADAFDEYRRAVR